MCLELVVRLPLPQLMNLQQQHRCHYGSGSQPDIRVSLFVAVTIS